MGFGFKKKIPGIFNFTVGILDRIEGGFLSLVNLGTIKFCSNDFRGHRGSVESVVNVADGVIASTGFDKSIKIWRDLDQLPDEVDEIKSKKRAKREDRGEVKTSGEF